MSVLKIALGVFLGSVAANAASNALPAFIAGPLALATVIVIVGGMIFASLVSAVFFRSTAPRAGILKVLQRAIDRGDLVSLPLNDREAGDGGKMKPAHVLYFDDNEIAVVDPLSKTYATYPWSEIDTTRLLTQLVVAAYSGRSSV